MQYKVKDGFDFNKPIHELWGNEKQEVEWLMEDSANETYRFTPYSHLEQIHATEGQTMEQYGQSIKDATEYIAKIPYMYNAVQNGQEHKINDVGSLVYAEVISGMANDTDWALGEKAAFNYLLNIDFDKKNNDEVAQMFNQLSRYEDNIDSRNMDKLKELGYVPLAEIEITEDLGYAVQFDGVDDVVEYGKEVIDVEFSEIQKQHMTDLYEQNGRILLSRATVQYDGGVWDVYYPYDSSNMTFGISDKNMCREFVQNCKTPEAAKLTCRPDYGITPGVDEKVIDSADMQKEVIEETDEKESDAIKRGEPVENWFKAAVDLQSEHYSLSEEQYQALVKSVNDNIERIHEEYMNSATPDADTDSDVFDTIEKKREELGLLGNESNIPAYQAKELAYGATREEYLDEMKAQREVAGDIHDEKMHRLFADAARCDEVLHRGNSAVFPDSDCTVLGRGNAIPSEYRDFVLNKYTGYHVLKDMQTRFEFDDYFDARQAKDLPWTKEWNDRYNQNIGECLDAVKDKPYTEKLQIARRVYASMQKKDWQGNSPSVDMDNIDKMGDAWYEVSDDEPIIEVERNDNMQTPNDIDFSKGVMEQEENVQAEKSANFHPVSADDYSVDTVEKNDGHLPDVAEEKEWHNTVENGVSGNPDYDFDEYD